MRKHRLRILVIDIGGSNVKLRATGRKEWVKIPSGPEMGPRQLVAAVRQATAGWQYNVVSLGYPGLVLHGRPAEDAPNLGPGWVRFNFRKAFGRPVKIVNDAAMQALGSYRGKIMLFLGLGTGLGSALVVQAILQPMELGDLPYKGSRTYAEFVGKKGRKRLGKARWSRHVYNIVQEFKNAVQADYVVLGGGQAELLRKLPPDTVRGDNSKAFLGGCRLWTEPPSLGRS